ncbi:hypothetical protein CTI12_AA602730 [Artemisia annua]|uniref:Uncharacterized protein n=1 Tax=Artemisia annua TaxID=35608 RepID=A0A2U1KHA9_ARTAN|nr:hypothetical protein CTI12_AA602730 [Artemisia annua]
MVGEMLSDKVSSIESGLHKLYTGYKVRADAMHDLNLTTSQNVTGENPSDYLVGFESFKSRCDKKALLYTRDWIFDQEGEGEDIRHKVKEIEKRLIEDIEKLI